MTKIRLANEDESSILSDLAVLSKNVWNYSQEFINQCRPLLRVFKRDILQSEVFVIEENNNVAGFYQLKHIDSNSVDLDKFFIHPDHLKRGLGKKLFEHAVKISQELEYKILVIESDPNAKLFYEKQGAKLTGYVESPITNTRKLPIYNYDLQHH